MALAFQNSALFCGLFTPLFSSCFIGNMVASGRYNLLISKMWRNLRCAVSSCVGAL